MNKKTTGIITIILLLLSPLIGGLLGRFYQQYIDFYSTWLDDVFCVVTILTCIIACIIFYRTFTNSEK